MVGVHDARMYLAIVGTEVMWLTGGIELVPCMRKKQSSIYAGVKDSLLPLCPACDLNTAGISLPLLQRFVTQRIQAL